MVELTINNGNEVLTRLWNNLISKGVVNRRLDSSRIGLLLSAIATELNTTLSLIKSYMNQFTLTTCTDRVLVENMARMFAVRRMRSKSKVVLEFSRISDYNESIKIPGELNKIFFPPTLFTDINQGCFLISLNPYLFFGLVTNIFLIKSLQELLKKEGNVNNPLAIL